MLRVVQYINVIDTLCSDQIDKVIYMYMYIHYSNQHNYRHSYCCVFMVKDRRSALPFTPVDDVSCTHSAVNIHVCIHS